MREDWQYGDGSGDAGGYTPQGPAGASGQPPPGFAYDPATGTYVGPQGLTWTPEGGVKAPLLPLPPGATRDPTTGAIIYPPGTPGGTPGTPGWDPQTVGFPKKKTVDPGPPEPKFPPPPLPPTPTGTMGGLLTPFGETFTAPTPQAYPSLPEFKPPPDFAYDPFAPPTLEQAMAKPGAQFQLQQGEQALEQSAAGQGILRTGGTLKNILDYGQKAAQTSYDQLFGQDLAGYQTNRANAADTWQKRYQSAYDQYQPQLFGWQTKEAQVQRDNETNRQSSWDQYMQKFNQYRTQKLDTNNILLGQQQLGLQAAGAS